MNKIKIILFAIIATLYSCREVGTLKYKVGDIVYLKPDSTKAVVSEVPGNLNDHYIVQTGYGSGFFANNIHHVDEAQIY